MIQSYSVLAARIRLELESLNKTVSRIEKARNARTENSENQELFLDSIALGIHDFYTGLERIFTQIATVVDGSMPSGKDWHRDLLIQMNISINGTRTRIISTEIMQSLDEYRRFRHLIRNIYAFELDPDKIQPLVSKLNHIFADLKTELLNFVNWLENVENDEE